MQNIPSFPYSLKIDLKSSNLFSREHITPQKNENRNHLLPFLNIYLHTKSQVHLKTFSSVIAADWFRAFWLKTDFPDVGLCRHKTSNVNFHFTANTEKVTTEFLEKLEKTLF